MRFITIQPVGRFGNQVIMYMAALAIAERLGGVTICGLGFPAWNIPEIAPPRDGLFETIYIAQECQFDLDAIAAAVAGKASFNIVLCMHMQKFSQLLDVTRYRQIFPLLDYDAPVFDDRYLLISIRIGDILNGHEHPFDWYPLMPIGFYQDIVERSGKLPVFIGEIDDCAYITALRAAFPAAIFLPRRSLMQDFDTIRRAKNILVAVSTFSWLAAWLSEAANIYLPVNGFYIPSHMPGIDLLPVDDQRYQFYLFPMNYAVSESESLRLHAKMRGRWRQISRRKLRALRDTPPRLAVMGTADLDPVWYLSEYLDAAMDISEGWYATAEAHYLDFGCKAGYLPFAPLALAPPPPLPNIALAKPALQSSVCEWSAQSTPTADAAGALDGDFRKAFGFHTAVQSHPWWQVDLQQLSLIREIHIYNRAGLYRIRARAAPLVLLSSVDGQNWAGLLRTAPGELFGAERGPLIWTGAEPVTAHYIRVMLDHEMQCLHLAQVAVFGEEI